MERKIISTLFLVTLMAMAHAQGQVSAQGHAPSHAVPQVGEFHRSDAQGNFQVNYQGGAGHYLTEDRSFDGSHLLGNYAYKSRDGESVGVAYGSDGAGFVISAPGYVSGASGGRGSSSGGAHRQTAAAAVPVDTTSFQHGTGAHFRYQDAAHPASQQPASSWDGSDVTSHSSLPGVAESVAVAPAAPSFAEQELHHQREQQLQHQLQLQFQQQLQQQQLFQEQQQLFQEQQQLQHQQLPAQLSSQSVTSSLTTNIPPPNENTQNVLTTPTVPHRSSPFAYSFDTFNSLNQFQQPATLTSQFQNQHFQSPVAAPAVSQTHHNVAPAFPQPQHFSYQQSSVDSSTIQYNPLLDRLVAELRAQQLAQAPPPSPVALVTPKPVTSPVVPPAAPLASFLPAPLASFPTAPLVPVQNIMPVMPNLLFLASRPVASVPAPSLVSYAFSSPGTDAIPIHFRFQTSPTQF